MIIDDLLYNAQMSRYRLSKLSGVPQATISDICSGKASLEKCSSGTLYRIAKVLGVTVDSILEAADNEPKEEHRSSFEIYKSTVCHYVKDMGDMDFIIGTLECDTIRSLYDKKWYPETMYLLAMVNYLSKKNNLPLCTNYNDIRQQKLERIIYPSSVLIRAAVMHSDLAKKEALEHAIPEFLRFNIVESGIDNIV